MLFGGEHPEFTRRSAWMRSAPAEAARHRTSLGSLGCRSRVWEQAWGRVGFSSPKLSLIQPLPRLQLSHSRACRESGLPLAPHHSGWSRPPAFHSHITLCTPNPFVVSSTLQSPTPAFFRKVLFNSGWNVHSVASIRRLLITRILQNLNFTAVE